MNGKATLLTFLVAVLGTIGALQLVPFIVKKALHVIRDTLDEISQFVLWWRDWRARLQAARAPVPKPQNDPGGRRTLAATLDKPA